MSPQKSRLQYTIFSWYQLTRYRPENRPFLRYFSFLNQKNYSNVHFIQFSQPLIGIYLVWFETSSHWLTRPEKSRVRTRVLGPKIELQKLTILWFFQFLLLFSPWSNFFELVDSIFVISDLDYPREQTFDSIEQFSRNFKCWSSNSTDFKIKFSRKLPNRVKSLLAGVIKVASYENRNEKF